MRNAMTTNRTIGRALRDRRGFTLVEVLVAAMILVVGLLGIATMFPVGYRQITDAGRMTMAVSGARQILEDVGSLPFTPNLPAMNNFDTTNVGTLPAADPERAVARRIRYMLAGPGDGFTFDGTDATNWGTPNTYGARAQVWVNDAVNCPGPAGMPNLARVCVTVTVQGLPTAVTVNTVVVRMF
jgi:prepilin-type N-terminal cleavage/methylation domain-containing protein